jgi:hypothetical protein
MELISMTEFVLLSKGILKSDNEESRTLKNTSFDSIVKYAEFLKQPLTLGLFVPCDEKGNPLPEPQTRPERNSFDEEDIDYDAQELYDYIQAKEKVFLRDL